MTDKVLPMRKWNQIGIMELTLKGDYTKEGEIWNGRALGFSSKHYFTTYKELEDYVKSFKRTNGIYDTKEKREITDKDVKQFKLYNYHNCDFDNDFGSWKGNKKMNEENKNRNCKNW